MRNWSDDEVKLLRKMYVQGHSAREIHEQLPSKTIHQVRSLITRKRGELGLDYRFKGTVLHEPDDSFSTAICGEMLRKKWT